MPELQDLIATVRELFRLKGPMGDKTRLYHDLGLSGDDALQLLEVVRNRFGTSFENMDFGRFFLTRRKACFIDGPSASG